MAVQAENSASNSAAIALNRFGLGARPGDRSDDWKAWLRGQIVRYDAYPAPIQSTPSTAKGASEYGELRAKANGPVDNEARQKARMDLNRVYREHYRAAVTARVANAVATDTPFAERLVHFWSNHFALSADKAIIVPFVGSFEVEAIRPHVMGRFEDLLLAVERHAGMLLYLDQAMSIGPDSVLAVRANANSNRKRTLGLNENLAREILELHTLGVRTGYTQADVTEFARALTGWSVGGFGVRGGNQVPEAAAGGFMFRPALHEPGERTILGKRYDQRGEDQAVAVIRDLTRDPATAVHIATKLARHFVSDDPPAELVAHLATAFSNSDGDLPTVYRALINSSEAWAPQSAKFKTPWEWAISTLRGVGVRDTLKLQIQQMLVQLGQPVWQPGSPAGWDDIAGTWAAPNALVTRVEAADRLAELVPETADPRALGESVLQGSMTPMTRQVIESADTRQTAIALLFVSPEFQRR